MAKVLVTDDDQGTREILQLILQEEGYEAEVASTGYEALHMLCTSDVPMLAIIDFMMPYIKGNEVLDVVKKVPFLAARHRYILMSANPELHAIEESGKYDGVLAATLFKPWDLDGFLDLVEREVALLPTLDEPAWRIS